MIKGTSASPGIALGRVLLLEQKDLNIENKNIDDVELEEKRFRASIEKSRKELIEIKEKVLKELGEKKAIIFEAHLMVLQDPELIDGTIEKIRNEKKSCEFALYELRNTFIEMFQAIEDEYMRERALDIKDVTDRIIRNILGEQNADLANIKKEAILACHDLTPSDIANMAKGKVLGFITNLGGRTSHSSIMARSMEIPWVVGLKNITSKVKNNDFIILDGESGEIIINPDEETKKKYIELKKEEERKQNELRSLIGKDTKTIDGHQVELSGNIGTPNDIHGLIRNDAEGVGLYRTEFLYMDKENFPSEEEQFDAYKKLLQAMAPKPIVIRTFDIGGDKELSYLQMDKEMNPFLGYRAIRICLDKVDTFKTQLRALLKVSVYGNLRIMFPMISSLEELLSAKDILEEVKKELTLEGIAFSKEIQVGMMIEVPSAAIISDILAKHVDFFSIGTNDLIQYTCAVDRTNEKINHLYNQFNPAVLKLIKLVVDNAHREGKWVGMCGEAAGDKRMIPILLGMGLDEFSMSPISILPARKLITSIKLEDAKLLADKVLKMGTAKEIESLLEEFKLKYL